MAGRSALINVMHKASVAASRRMMRDFGEVENLQVTRKGAADFVSQADIAAERTIQEELQKARPDWGFIMEEAGEVKPADKDAPCWIIDPIDGTTNFLHGIPHFAISIAVRDKGKIIAGTI
ncbi:MAG: inositol monophosphatase, partial [Proteobacteria bacterium]|nr:inositol monophosphatase [Pseudomonadota bacterium]